MSVIGFRREGGELEYLEETFFREDNLEDDLHELIEGNPDFVMNTLTGSGVHPAPRRVADNFVSIPRL